MTRVQDLSVVAAIIAVACGTPGRPGTSPSAARATKAAVAAPVKAPGVAASAQAPSQAFEHTAPEGSPACSLVGSPWLPENEGVLTLRPDGGAFVNVTVSEAEIRVPLGKASAVFVRMVTEGWHVAGHLAATSFSVKPLRSIVHDGFLVPSELTDLELVDAEPGRLWLAARAPLPVARLAGRAEPVAYPCDDVNLGPPPLLDAMSSLPGDPATRRPSSVGVGEIPLALAPGSPPVAWLRVDQGDRDVFELDRHGNYRQIALTGYTTLVFGWVPKARVRARPKEPETAGAFATGGLGLSGSGTLGTSWSPTGAQTSSEASPHALRRRCGADVPLLVRAGSEVFEVGSIEAGTLITSTGRGDGAEPLLPPRSLTPAPGAAFEAPEWALAHCAKEPQP